MSTPVGSDETIFPRAGMEIVSARGGGWRWALAAMAAGITILLIGYGETVDAVVRAWSNSDTYRFAWLVPPSLFYLFWLNRRRLAALPPRPTPIGIVAAMIAAVFWIVADATNVNEGRQVALLAAVGAIVLAAVGWNVTRRLLPFLAMLVFLVPTGTFLLDPLKSIAVAIVEGFAAITRLPVETQGFTVYVGTHRYVVIDPCAGLAFLWIGLFLGLCFGLLLYRVPWKIAALTLTGGALGILLNGVRIIAVLVTDHIIGTQMELSGHRPFQWATLGLTVCLMLALVAKLRMDAPEPPTNAETECGVTDRLLRRIVAWPLLAAAMAVSGPYLTPSAAIAPDAASVTPLAPENLAGWTRGTAEPGWSPVARDEVSRVTATYDRGGNTMTVLVAEATSPRSKVSGGAVDLVGDPAWMTASTRIVEACAADRCLRVRHLELFLKKSKSVRHVYTTYAVGERLTLSVGMLRLLRAWALVRGDPSPARLLAVATDSPEGLSPPDIARVLYGLLDDGA
jgi:exosortase